MFHSATALVSLGSEAFSLEGHFDLEPVHVAGERHSALVSRVAGSFLQIRVLPGAHTLRFVRRPEGCAVRISMLGAASQVIDLHGPDVEAIDVDVVVPFAGRMHIAAEPNSVAGTQDVMTLLGLTAHGRPGWNPPRLQISSSYVLESRRAGTFLRSAGSELPRESYLLEDRRPRRSLASLVLSPGDTVAQLRAREGFDTTHLSQLVGASGHVFAFEQDLREFRLGAANIEMNGCRNVTWLYGAFDDGSSQVQQAFGNAPPLHSSLDVLCSLSDRLDLVILEGPDVSHMVKRSVRCIEQFRPRLLLRLTPDRLFSRAATLAATYDALDSIGYAADHLDGRGTTRLRRSWSGRTHETFLILATSGDMSPSTVLSP